MIQDQTTQLRGVYVREPRRDDLSMWRSYGWRDEPDPLAAEQEHAAFRAELERAGAKVEIAAEELGVAIVGELSGPATAEGGDLCWLDPSTLLAGRGYRTNDEGIAQLRALVTPLGIEVVAFDLPHLRGREACLHLLSLMSPLAPDLAVVYPRLMPVRLVELLLDRGVELVEVPDEEFNSMGANVLALAPRVALALDGNPETRRRMEAAGVDVRTYRGVEISRKGDGGPTCLTRPLVRA